ncbi:HEAT repeat-containing protein 3 [Wickerhamomyces ciferrii]|uniref:HEAT repeat-containing protein 3 n=1 Tax=Wickerhamomyces ciferrii (strain ATCC 14091 / BCRC 22168 / CBS 111 / JCM 3599 / NBRC 0793 / NRRL Y-1031 F-60-10) TaxID=1206466 RepID=K0KXC6_WICCF|nr:HEAT repeat-containing protein 3 [Wickerhamomyces ciferrii]CCH46134.1 HEAT repeat-containing protein 3 [Wickerhamomyces ciferrii]
MGKLKKKSRSSRHRVNPVANRKKGAEQQDAALRETKILPIIAKLKSVIPNDKSMALGTITIMCEDPKYKSLLLKEKLLQLIMEQCLVDDNSEIIVESFGLLRNLVIEEGYDVATYLWRQNIWVTLENNLNKAQISFQALKNDPKKVQKNESRLLFDYIENLISLIVGLGNGSDDLFEQITNKLDSLVIFIKEILNYGLDLNNNHLRISGTLFSSILDLIYDFSSQSVEFIQNLDQILEIDINKLQEFSNKSKLNKLTMVYIQGIKLQLLEASNISNGKDEILYNIINDSLSTIQDINIENERNVLIENMDNTTNINITEETKKRSKAKSNLQAISLTIEVITATIEIIAVGRTPEEDVEIKETEDDPLFNSLLGRVPEVLTFLLSYDEYKTGSLTALNNLNWLFATLRIYLDEWSKLAKNLWTLLTMKPEENLENKISLFGILWAISSVNHDDIPISDDFIKSLINEYQTVSNDESLDLYLKEEYLVRLIGFLASLAQTQGQIERNGEISGFLMLILNQLPNVSSKIVIEILDLIYEIFGDLEYDYDYPIFVERQYLQKLEELSPKIKHSIRLVDKNVNPELKIKGEEVLNNLVRFIDYKKKERGL